MAYSTICKFKSRTIKKIKVIFSIICFICCLINVYVCFEYYFKYETVALTGPYISLYQEVPRTSLCFTNKLREVENRTFIQLRLEDEKTLNKKKIRYSKSDAPKIIENCGLRNFSTEEIDEDVECSSIFEIEERTRRFYRCFMFTPWNRTYDLFNFVTSYKSRSLLYKMTLVQNQTHLIRVLPMVHYKTWPYDEFVCSIDLDLTISKKQLYKLSYEIIEFLRLPSPYDTNCVEEYEPICSISGTSRINRCNRPLCQDKLTVTYSTLSNEVANDGIHFQIKTTERPVLRTSYRAAIGLTSFLVILFSIIGLWLNISTILLFEKSVEMIKFLKNNNIDKNYGKNNKNIPKEELTRELSSLYKELICISNVVKVNLKGVRKSFLTKQKDPTKIYFKNIKKLLRVVAKIIILILCLIQLSNISIYYFAYPTKMEITFNIRIKTNHPSLSYCVEIKDVFKYERPSFRFERFDEKFTDYTNKFNLSLEEYFKLSPSEDLLIIKCRVRDSLTSPLVLYDECRKFFNVSKFVQDNEICYYIQSNFEYDLYSSDLRKNLNNPGMIFSVVINEKLVNFTYFQPIISYGHPYTSRFLSSQIWRQKEKRMHLLTSINYNYKELPPPYDTNCIDRDDYSSCNIKCMNSNDSFHFLPYSELYKEPIPGYLIRYVDLKNDSVAKLIGTLENKCDSLCSRRECESNITKTIYSHEYSSHEMLELVVMNPMYPLQRFTATPVYRGYEFVYQIACSLSFWFGFSLIKLNDFFGKRKYSQKISSDQKYLSGMVDELDKIVSLKLNRKRKKFILIKLKLNENIINCTFMVVCFIGFLIQSFQITNQYLQYPTIMDTRLVYETDFSLLHATFCVTIQQLDLQGDYSVKNIYQKSPHPGEILCECGHRGLFLDNIAHLPILLKQRIIPEVNSTVLCNQFFKIRKMIKYGMVCYSIRPRDEKYSPEFNSKYHIVYSKVYQFLSIRNSLAKYNLTISVSHEEPSTSLFLSGSSQSITEKRALWSWVSYIKYFTTFLAHPYDMGVFNGMIENYCVGICVDKIEKKRGVLSSYGRVTEADDLIHETTSERFSPTAELVRSTCRRRCRGNHKPGITISYTKTYYEPPFEEPTPAEFGSISYWFRNSDYLVTKTKFFPKLRFIDLLIYLGSIFFIWFGICSLDIANWLLSPKLPTDNLENITLIKNKLSKIQTSINKQISTK